MKNKSQFVSAFGTSFEIFKALTEEVMCRGGSDDDIRRILSDPVLKQDLAERIMLYRAAAGSGYTFIMDYDTSVGDLILAGGYALGVELAKRPIFCGRFSSGNKKGKIKINVRLEQFKDPRRTIAALTEWEKAGYVPAGGFELLGLAKNFHEFNESDDLLICAPENWWKLKPTPERYAFRCDVPWIKQGDGQRELSGWWHDTHCAFEGGSPFIWVALYKIVE